MLRPEITVPAFVITRSPDAVSVTPGGKPVLVASGHPPAGVVVAKVVLLFGSTETGTPTGAQIMKLSRASESPAANCPTLQFGNGRRRTAFLRRHRGLAKVIFSLIAKFGGLELKFPCQRWLTADNSSVFGITMRQRFILRPVAHRLHLLKFIRLEL